MSMSGWSLCGDSEQQPDAIDMTPDPLPPSLLVDKRSQLQSCDGHVDMVHQLALLIAGDKPDDDGLLEGAELRKPELLVQARLVLLDNRADLEARRDALLLLQWCAAQQPLAPDVKVKEEVQYYINLAQHGRFPQTKLWASGALVMLACQPATQLLVIGDEGSARILTSLVREALMQPNVQLHILAHCARFICHVTSLPGQEQLLQLCIHQLTEPLLLLLGEGGTTTLLACGALLALIKAQPQATAAAVNRPATGRDGAGARRCDVTAVLAALERELAAVHAAAESGRAAGVTAVEDSAFSGEEAAPGDEAQPAPGPAAAKGSVSGASGSEDQEEEAVLGQLQPLAHRGQARICLSASLLALLRHLLEQPEVDADDSGQPPAAMGSALSHEGTISLLVRCLQMGSQEGGADAMRCLAVLLQEPQARDHLLAAEGAVDEVASHWRLAPAAAAQALWEMKEHLQTSIQCEALLQLLGHPPDAPAASGAAPVAPSDGEQEGGEEDAEEEAVLGEEEEEEEGEEEGEEAVVQEAYDFWPEEEQEVDISSIRRFGDTLQCVKTMVEAGHWGPWDQAAGAPALLAAPPALLAALDQADSNLYHLGQLPAGRDVTRTLMELWALLSSNPETALQLALGAEAPTADGTASSLPCCACAAMDQLQQLQAAPMPPPSPRSPHLALMLNLLRAACAQQQPPDWVGQHQGNFLGALQELLHLQLHAPPSPESADLQALQLCALLSTLHANGHPLSPQLTPQMLLLSTSSSFPQGQPETACYRPAAAWSPLDVLQAKLGLLQRLMDHDRAAGDSGVLPLLLHLLVTGPLAADSPPPPSDYSPLLGATPDSMRRQVLQLVRQTAEALPMGSRTWAREELQRALDAASSCKAGQPRKQELANCVALAALWLDLQLQGDEEEMNNVALDLHLRSLRARLQAMVPWALELVPLLMDCPAAATTLLQLPSSDGSAPSVLQAAGAILDLVSLHSIKPALPALGLTPLAAHRWVLAKLAAATAEERSILAVTVTTAALAAKEKQAGEAAQAAKDEKAALAARAQSLQAELTAANAALSQSQVRAQSLQADVAAASAALSQSQAQVKKMQDDYVELRDRISKRGYAQLLPAKLGDQAKPNIYGY